MKTLFTRWLTVTLVVFLSCPLPPPVQAAKRRSKSKAKKTPAPAVVETQPNAWPPAEFTVGILTGGEDTEGLGDILIPLWNPGNRGLLFANPRGSFTSNDEEEINIGVGYRQLLPGDKVIVGANAYYDYRDTGDNTYDQWGVGFEILSTWIDARANYYNPDDDENIIASETDTSTRQSSSSSSEWSDPYAEDHYIVQDYTTTRTLTTVTSTRTYEQYEAAFGGYDWEIGVRLPVPIQSETMEVRVFGGMYDFDQDYGGDAQGWKARGELRLFSSLFLDGGLYENDELTGSDWFAGARLNVPLDLGALSRGRNPFSTAKSRWEAAPRDLSSRLTEMVMRDSQIRIETSDFIENMSLFAEETATARSRTSETLALVADVNFVDSETESLLENGSAAYPFSSIQLGVDNVFGSRNVYVFDASAPYQENVVLTPGVSLIGSGILIPGINSTTFGSGTRPIVDGVCLGPAITLADGTTVTGFRIQNTGRGCAPLTVNLPVIGSTDVNRVGILGNGATDLTLTDNLITGNSIGVLLARQGDFRMNFSHNEVVDNDDRGMAIWGQGNSGSFNVAIDDSTFANNTGDGLLIDASTYDQSIIQVQDSQFLNNTGNGLLLRQANSLQAVAALSGIEATGNEASGLRIQAEDNGVYNAMISNATLRTSGEDGFQLSGTGNTTAGVWITSSRFEDNVANGSMFQIESNDLFVATIQNSTLSDNGEGGLLTQADDNGSVGIDIENSTFSANRANGAEFTAENNGLFVATVEGSTFTNSNGSGLAAQALGNGTASVSIASSTFTANGANGAEFLAEDNDLFQVTVEDSSFTGNGTGGFGQQTENNGRVEMRIDNSLFANNGATALRAQTTGDTTFEAALTDNTFSGNNGNGLWLLTGGTDAFQATIEGSHFLDNDAIGLQIEGQNGDTFAVSIESSSFSNNAGPGLDLTASGYDTALAQIQTSTFTGNGAEGAALQLDNNDQSTVTVANSQASQNTGTGIQAGIDNTTAGWIGFSNVVASQNGQMGADASIQNATEGHVEVSGLTADENRAGVTINLGAATQATAILNAIQANGNLGLHGVRVAMDDVEEALANLSNISANDNAGGGIEVNLNNFVFSMALVSGSQANGNGDNGIHVNQENGIFSIANISGSTANSNGMRGVYLEQDSAFASIGIVGLPEGLGDSVGEITAGFGLTLPEELVALLGAEGPVMANDNVGTGVQATIQATDIISLAALFDITANENGSDGISAMVENDHGIAVTLGGSSENWGDMIELADGLIDELLGTNLPLAIAGTGQMQANNNAGTGVNLTTVGEIASITAMAGIEAISNGAYGVIAQNIADDLSLTALARVEATDNTLGGIAMTTFGNDLAAIGVLADINASNNDGHGIQANVTSPNGAAAFLTLSTDALRPLGPLLGTELLGIPIDIPGSTFGPVVASGNNGHGIEAVVNGESLALALLLDTVTSDNTGDGLNLDVNSGLGFSIAAVLSSDLLYSLIPDELGLPIVAHDPIGPVEASFNSGHGIRITQSSPGTSISVLAGIDTSNNTNSGVEVMSHAVDGITLAALFDITANNNGSQGIWAHIENDNGIAATIGGSSQNWSEILQLADNIIGPLFGLDLPLTIDATGQMQANDNAYTGVNLTTMGGMASITAMVGIQATNNGAYGVIAQNFADDLSLTALARITAIDNASGGLQMITYSEDFASIGLLADINASNNDGHGIEAQVLSISGAAALLTLSTDILRPLGTWLGNEFLSGPVVIPGSPFGPVTASGNTGDGIRAEVNGPEFALAAFMDTVASDNDGDGIRLDVHSWDGLNIVAMLSSDLLFDLANGALGLTPPIAYDPLGPVTANNNGGTGIRVSQYTLEDVYTVLAGVEANGNASEGIHLDLGSNIGDVYALLAGTVTDGNQGGAGTRLELDSDFGATVTALIGVQSSGNTNGAGISVTQNSTLGDTYALLAGVHTVSNAGHGLDYALTAGGEAAVFMTFVESDNNTGMGANFAVSVENDIIWVAESDLAGLASYDSTVSNMLDSFGGILPTGASSFSENDGIGLNAELTSDNGDILAIIDGVDFVGNTDGLNLTMHALNGSIMGGLFNSTASINEGHGAYVYGRGAGGNLAFGMTNSVFTSNGDNGIYIRTRYTGPVGIFSEGILSTGNTNYGVRIRMASLGTNVPVIDFGGGLLGSLGQSMIHGNDHRDFRINNAGGATVMAQSNWWGANPPASGQFAGNVNYTNWLVVPPIP